MSEWQPIETAPKDGSDVLLAFADFPDAPISQGCYAKGAVGYPDAWAIGGFLLHEMAKQWNPEGQSLMFIDAHKKTEVSPTHWMPLPAPPEQTKPET